MYKNKLEYHVRVGVGMRAEALTRMKKGELESSGHHSGSLLYKGCEVGNFIKEPESLVRSSGFRITQLSPFWVSSCSSQAKVFFCDLGFGINSFTRCIFSI